MPHSRRIAHQAGAQTGGRAPVPARRERPPRSWAGLGGGLLMRLNLIPEPYV